MPPSPANSGIRDNNDCGSVGGFLKPHIRDGSQMSVVSAYFTIYAYAALIRNRLLRLTADSPDLLAIIKQEGPV